LEKCVALIFIQEKLPERQKQCTEITNGTVFQRGSRDNRRPLDLEDVGNFFLTKELNSVA
jgi:hypothetical protein